MWQTPWSFYSKAIHVPFLPHLLRLQRNKRWNTLLSKTALQCSVTMWPGSEQWDQSQNNQMGLLRCCFISTERQYSPLVLCLPSFFSSVPRRVIAILRPWRQKPFTKDGRVRCNGSWSLTTSLSSCQSRTLTYQ